MSEFDTARLREWAGRATNREFNRDVNAVLDRLDAAEVALPLAREVLVQGGNCGSPSCLSVRLAALAAIDKALGGRP